MTADKVKSAARVFEILEFFASHRQPARLHELGAALGYPVSSLTALLRTMLDMGYMTLDPATHAYLPAPRLQTLTGWMQVDDYEQTVLFDALCRLREAVEGPHDLALLGVPEQGDLREAVLGSQKLRHRLRVRDRRFQRRPEPLRIVVVVIADHQSAVLPRQIRRRNRNRAGKCGALDPTLCGKRGKSKKQEDKRQ